MERSTTKNKPNGNKLQQPARIAMKAGNEIEWKINNKWNKSDNISFDNQ